MNETKIFSLEKSMDYNHYFQLTEELLNQGKTTGPNQSEDYVYYTKLNFQRMKRLNKTVTIIPELAQIIEKINTPQTWLVLSEAWCGDAAQNIPILQKMADLSKNIELKIVLRDENLELMDRYLTNGGRSIPKLIAFENNQQEELFTWGPRPATIQKVMEELIAQNITDLKTKVEKIQIAYNTDKCLSIQNEFIEILKGIN